MEGTPSQVELDGGRLRAQLEKIRADARVPGMVVSVRTVGRQLDLAVGSHDLAHERPLEAGASFAVGCLVKPLLAMATLALTERARLALDEPIGIRLHELCRTAHGRSVRIEHLLCHTSGYRGFGQAEAHAGPDWPAIVDFVSRTPRLFSPGVAFSYEHSETVLLARILARASGLGITKLIDSLALAPLGLRSTGRATAGRHGCDAAGGWLPIAAASHPVDAGWQPGFERALSVPSLAAIGQALLARRSPYRALLDGGVALPAMLAGPACPELPVGFARGLARYAGGWLGASGFGAGQCLALRVHPRARVVIAIGINAMVPALRDTLVSALAADCVPRHDPGRGATAAGRPALWHGASRARAVPGAALETFAGDYIGARGAWIRARKVNDEALGLEIGVAGVPGRLHARVLDRGAEVELEAEVPQLALGLAVPAPGTRCLMLGLTAFKRVGVCTDSRQ